MFTLVSLANYCARESLSAEINGDRMIATLYDMRGFFVGIALLVMPNTFA